MNAKKIILVVVVVFLGFRMLTEPSGMADAAEGGWGVAEEFFRGSSTSSMPLVTDG